ncbi:lysylphosphatidylglycerol synthase transmembrane domain-containing protein [Spirosoma harenae]
MMHLLKRILPLLLGLILLAYVLKGISFEDIGTQFKQADYWWILLTGFLTTLTFFVRGMRSTQPLLALGYHPTTFRVTIALLAGTIAGMIVPGSGELTRCATLQRTDGIAFSHAVGAVLAERVLDFFVLIGVCLLTFTLEYVRLQTYFSGYALNVPSGLGWILLSVGVLAAGLIYWFFMRTDWSAPRWQHPFIQKVIGFIRGLRQGLLSLKKLPNPALFIFLTVLNQVMAWLMTYSLMMSLESTRELPILSVLTIETVSLVAGVLIPTQGGIGSYHLLVSRVLTLYGFSIHNATVLATFLHAVGFFFNLLISSIGFLIASLLVTRKPITVQKSATDV